MKKLTKEWVRKAESDYRVAVKLAKDKEAFHDARCFHCQQSAEKYLKALLQELGHTIPRTHVLRDLLFLLLPHHGKLDSLQRGMTFLTRFAVETRYPGERAANARRKLPYGGRNVYEER